MHFIFAKAGKISKFDSLKSAMQDFLLGAT